ncbi:uncharacterized protein LOC125333164 [Corvus hawaiiensis]|uniref:uncharacterized protein LOC125333164 n=1 Tax=Corvus hawaiiensis TaxID=134902 RepID=UPI0020184EB0|nr:uncharacterized protein LOC125333164 [Corvus hawaiiensis]
MGVGSAGSAAETKLEVVPGLEVMQEQRDAALGILSRFSLRVFPLWVFPARRGLPAPEGCGIRGENPTLGWQPATLEVPEGHGTRGRACAASLGMEGGDSRPREWRRLGWSALCKVTPGASAALPHSGNSRPSLIPVRHKEAGIGFWGGIWEGRGRELRFPEASTGPGCAGGGSQPRLGEICGCTFRAPGASRVPAAPQGSVFRVFPPNPAWTGGGRPLWLQEIPSGSHVTPSHHPGALLLLPQLAAPTLHFLGFFLKFFFLISGVGFFTPTLRETRSSRKSSQREYPGSSAAPREHLQGSPSIPPWPGRAGMELQMAPGPGWKFFHDFSWHLATPGGLCGPGATLPGEYGRYK